jgi:tripartite-type tricarboxylate transporter receptor subunit TctC
MELLKSESPLKMAHIPYKGPTPAVQAVLSGEVSCGLLSGNVVVPLANSGRVKVLAVTHSKRYGPLPQVPTVTEAGYPGAEVEIMLTLSAPKGTPPAVIQVVESAFRKALADSKVSRTLTEAGLEPDVAGRQEVQAEVDAASRKWGGVIRRIGLKVE